MRTPLTYSLILILLAVSAFTLWNFYQNSKFYTTTPTIGTIIKEVSLPGTVDAEEKLELSFKTSGKIATLSARVGQKVKKGDVLAALDRVSLWQSLQQAYADLNAANSNYYKARDKLGSTVDTYKTDPSTTQARTAIGQEKTAADAALFALEKTKNQVEISRKAWTDAALYAPFDGEIVKVSGQVGEIVSALDSEPLIILVNFSTAYFRGELDEKDEYLVRIGQPVVVSLDGFPNTTFPGTVTLIEKKIEKNSRGDLIIPIRIEIDLDEEKPALDASGDGLITIEKKENALLLPKKAVYNRGGSSFVKAKDQNGPREKALTTGIFDGKNWEITSGLSVKDNVLIPKD